MLRSINLPQGLLQANLVERIQQTQQQHPDVQQRYFEIALAKEQKRTGETVNDTKKAEQTPVGRDGGSREEGKRSAGRGTENAMIVDEETAAPSGEGESGKMVDVKV